MMSEKNIKKNNIGDGGKDNFQLFFLDLIAKYPLLTSEEENALFERLEKNPNDNEAIEKLVYSNARLVYKIASQYVYGETGIEDLFQAGNVGLMTAINKYNYHLGYRFSTYAVNWITQSIFAQLNISNSRIRIPQEIRSDMNRLARYRNEFLNEYGRAPTEDEIIFLSNGYFTYDRIHELDGLFFQFESIDKTIGKDEKTEMSEIVSDQSDIEITDEINRDELKIQTNKLISKLPKQEREVISLILGITDGEPKTNVQVASIMNLSRERIRVIRKSAEFHLRKIATDEKKDYHHY